MLTLFMTFIEGDEYNKHVVRSIKQEFIKYV
jgi:hypothetical protein